MGSIAIQAPTLKTQGVNVIQAQTNEAISSERYTVDFLWCNLPVTWQVTVPIGVSIPSPDFIFHDEGFQPLLMYTEPDLVAAVKSFLLNWGNHGQLQGLLERLRALYREHQRARLLSLHDDRITFELSTLPDPERSELYLVHLPDAQVSEARIGVPVDEVDLSALSSIIKPGVEASQGLMLHVSYMLIDAKMDNQPPDLNLQLPKWLADYITAPQLPNWTGNMCITEYLPLVTDCVHAHFERQAQAIVKRMELVCSLGQLLGSPIEAHGAAGTALFALRCDGEPCTLLLEAGPRFPEEQPVLTWRSIRLAGEGSVYKNYPWSPRWSAAEMGARMFNFLKDERVLFSKKLALAARV